MPSSKQDRPAWERDSPRSPTKTGTAIEGYLDYLTWQSRRIRLSPDNADALSFSRMTMLQGLCIPDDFGPSEPMATYVRAQDGTYWANPYKEGRSLWRDSHVLLGTHTETSKPPASMIMLEGLKDRGILGPGQVLVLCAFGMCSDRAKISLWRHETMPIPLAYLGDDELVGNLSDALQRAEDANHALFSALWRLALIARQAGGKKLSKEQRGEIQNMVASFRHENRYWPKLENAFRSFLLQLPGDSDHQSERLTEWTRKVCRLARAVFDQIIAGLDPSPRTLKGVHQTGGAQHVLNAALKEIEKRSEG